MGVDSRIVESLRINSTVDCATVYAEDPEDALNYVIRQIQEEEPDGFLATPTVTVEIVENNLVRARRDKHQIADWHTWMLDVRDLFYACAAGRPFFSLVLSITLVRPVPEWWQVRWDRVEYQSAR